MSRPALRRLALALALLASATAWAPARAQTAVFKLQTRPATAGADVVLDGQPIGTTNDSGALLVNAGAGTHRVQVLAGGAVLADRSVRFDSDLNFVRIDVQAPSVKVLLDTNVAGAAVSVNGRQVATTQADGRALLELPGGATYQLRVAKSGYQEASSRVAVADLDRRVSLRLAAAGAPAPPAGTAAPLALRRAVDAFFAGDYAQTLAQLAGQTVPEPRLQAQVELFRAAAAHALYLLGGERDAAGLAAARAAVARCRALAPALTPDRRAFSPRFLAFYARPG